MVQVLMWTVFIVAVLSVVAAWYLLVGLVTVGIAIAAYWVRKKSAQKAVHSLASPENGVLSAQESAIAESAGQLQLVDGSALRVVESSQHNENHRWLAEKYQIERAETLEIPGLVLAGTQWPWQSQYLNRTHLQPVSTSVVLGIFGVWKFCLTLDGGCIAPIAL